MFGSTPKKNPFDLWAEKTCHFFGRELVGYAVFGIGVMRLDMTLLEFLKWNNYKGHSHRMVGSLGFENHEIGVGSS